MRWLGAALLTAILALSARGAETPPVDRTRAEINDLEAARELFERNLDAIRHRDQEGYLACYWHNSRLTRNGNRGPSFGYEAWAQSMGDDWPTVFDAKALQLTWIHPGVVYGSYRYRIVVGGQETTGMSERVFLKTGDGWRIAVSTAFQNPSDVPPAPLLLQGCAVWTGEGDLMPKGAVSIQDGMIACVGTCGESESVDTVDLTGYTVVPDFGRGGILAVDAPADLLVLEGNPLTDPAAWARVAWVITGGEMRAPAHGNRRP